MQRHSTTTRGDAGVVGEQLARDFEIRPTDYLIAVMGLSGVGKTSFISQFTDVPLQTPQNPITKTTKIKIYKSVVPGKDRVFLVDTPGFEDIYKSDVDVLRDLTDWLSECRKDGIQLTGMVYLHRISDPRMTTSGLMSLRILRKLCGEVNIGSVAFVTTFWKEDNTQAGLQREQELITDNSLWGEMIRNGSTVFRYHNNTKSATTIIDYLINKHCPVVLDIQKEMVDHNLPLDQTTAGREMEAELIRRRNESSTQLEQIKNDMVEAIKRRNKEELDDLADHRADLRRNMEKDAESRRKLQVTWQELRSQRANEQDIQSDIVQLQSAQVELGLSVPAREEHQPHQTDRFHQPTPPLAYFIQLPMAH